MDGTTLKIYLWTVQHLTVTFGRYNTYQLPLDSTTLNSSLLDGTTLNSYLWTVQHLTVFFGRYNT